MLAKTDSWAHSDLITVLQRRVSQSLAFWPPNFPDRKTRAFPSINEHECRISAKRTQLNFKKEDKRGQKRTSSAASSLLVRPPVEAAERVFD